MGNVEKNSSTCYEERGRIGNKITWSIRLIWVACDASWGQVNILLHAVGDQIWVWSPTASRDQSVSMSMGWVTTVGHVDASGLCCSLKQCWWLLAMLPPEAIWMWVTCTNTWSCGDVCGWIFWGVHGVWYCKKPYGSLWATLPLAVKSKKATFTVTLMIVDA
jgi:hypothetical protein